MNSSALESRYHGLEITSLANANITESRRSFYHQRLTESAGNEGAQWKIVRELLHSDDDETAMKPADAKRLCTQFSHFFIKKLQRIGHEIETQLYTTRPSAQTVCRAPSSVTLSDFSAVTE